MLMTRVPDTNIVPGAVLMVMRQVIDVRLDFVETCIRLISSALSFLCRGRRCLSLSHGLICRGLSMLDGLLRGAAGKRQRGKAGRAHRPRKSNRSRMTGM